MYMKSYCRTRGVGVDRDGGGIGESMRKMLKFLSFFNVMGTIMGKVLTGKLSCPGTGLVFLFVSECPGDQ